MVKSRSYIATPPGATIKEQLNDRGMSQKEFAARMDMSEKHISRLINGDVQLTPETAVRLEMVLGIPAKFWNNLEAIYREKLIKAEMENAMDADAELAKKFPYIEMSKMGWVPETRDVKERVIYLRKYFEVVELSLLENEQITRIACRRLAITEKSDLALMAWAQEAKIKARTIQTAPINIKGLIASISDIRKMTVMEPDEFCPKIKKYLAECGVASRRACDEMIRAGRVSVNGRTAILGDDVSDRDDILLDGVAVSHSEKHRYYMMNKPKGYMCTVEDDRGRKTVMQLLPDDIGRVYPVGRLDYDTEGFEWMECHAEEKRVYVFERRSEKECLIAAFNFSDAEQAISVKPVQKEEKNVSHGISLTRIFSSEYKEYGGQEEEEKRA